MADQGPKKTTSKRKWTSAARAGGSGPMDDDSLLTNDKIDAFWSADRTDRERLRWALQTETQVRLDKVENRESLAVSETLASPHLFDVYPAIAFTIQEDDVLAKDICSWRRPCHPTFATTRPPDESFETLHRLDLSRQERAQNSLDMGSSASNNLPAVPPNFLYFQIILEAYLGYSWAPFHADDRELPRAALMGGAVVAALTAWRDAHIVDFFADAGLGQILERPKQKRQKKVEAYKIRKEGLLTQIHTYFWRSSCFAAGDVDVFLQASPLTRRLMRQLHVLGLGVDLRNRVQGYIGGCGFVQSDLQRISKQAFGAVDNPNTEVHESSTLGEKEGNIGACTFVYAITRNALNSLLTVDYDGDDSNRDEMWPRNTQSIMLNEKADLCGGLLDFDISLCACAYDGNGVRVAPRAAFSLVTGTQVVTPFVMKEARNWQRIVKYYKRGFQPYVMDPNCEHPEQCTPEGVNLDGRANDNQPASRHPNNSRWGRTARKVKIYEVTAFQEEHGRFRSCHCQHLFQYPYSFVLFEKDGESPLEFFAKYNSWSDGTRLHVEETDPRQRVACRRCRYSYENYVFLKSTTDEMHTVEDFLHHQQFRRQQHRNIFEPSFYSGGVFDSRRGPFADDFPLYQALTSLQSQLDGEQTKYFIKHGTKEGFKPRFAFGDDMGSLFEKASAIVFSEGARPTVGLNPERFIEKCPSCKEWLLGYEFNTEYCEPCGSRKQAAIER